MPVQYSYTSTPPMGRTARTEPQCLYSTAMPLLPLWAVQPGQGLSACTRVNFTFYLCVSKAIFPQVHYKIQHHVVIHLPFSTGTQCFLHALVMKFVSDSQVLTWQYASCMMMPIRNTAATLFMSHTSSQCLNNTSIKIMFLYPSCYLTIYLWTAYVKKDKRLDGKPASHIVAWSLWYTETGSRIDFWP